MRDYWVEALCATLAEVTVADSKSVDRITVADDTIRMTGAVRVSPSINAAIPPRRLALRSFQAKVCVRALRRRRNLALIKPTGRPR